MANNHEQEKAEREAATDSLSRIVIRTPEQSEYLQKYSKYLPNSILEPTEQELFKLLSQNEVSSSVFPGSSSSPQSQHIPFQSHLVHEVNNSQMMVFTICISTFQLKITLLNVKERNPLLNYAHSMNGNYGLVYQFPFMGSEIALKIFRVIDPLHMSYIINRAMKQYAIMKICSILRCAPHLSLFLGFNLIVYDDSVMFGMGMCRPIDRLDRQMINQLKRNIKTMHKCRIIHFDVKPENLMYSPYLQAPVFIDFGFSQIVEEPLGQMTLMQFRGSPGFCSEEMTKLIGCSSSGLIDVYFNDMYGLKESLGHLKFSTIEQADELLQKQSISNREQIQHTFLIYLLKYRLLMKQKTDIVSILRHKDHLLLQKYGTQILKIFENIISSQFFEEIYRELNREFQKFIEPTKIEIFFKYHRRAFSLHGKAIEQSIDQQTPDITFRNRIQNNFIAPQSFVSFEKYREFLQIQNVLCNPIYEEQSKYIIIESLRFDCKNNSLQQKIDISLQFNQAFGVKSQPNLSSIKASFQILLGYSLALPRTNWKKEHIFLILNQCLMLDINFQPYLDQFALTILEMHATFKDLLRCSIQLITVIYLQSFKHLSDYQNMIMKIPYKLHILGQNILEKTLKFFEFSDDKEVLSIITVIRTFIGPNHPKAQQNYSQIMKNLDQFKDNPFKTQLLEFLYLENLQLTLYGQRSNETYELLHYIKQFTFYQIYRTKKEAFHYSVYLISRILILSKNYKELQLLFSNIIESINCNEVSTKFKFQMSIFLFGEAQDTEILHRFSLETLQSFNSLTNVKLNYEFTELLEKIKKNKEFIQRYPEVIDKLSSSFAMFYEPLQREEHTLTNSKAEQLMFYFNLINFFTTVSSHNSEDLRRAIMNKLQQKTKQYQQISHLKYSYFKFQLQLYSTIFNQKNGRVDKALESFEELYRISREVLKEKIQYFFLQKMIMSAIQLNHAQKVLRYTYQYYNMASHLTSFSRYFQIKEKPFITITLYQFANNQDLEGFYDFLVVLSKFITKFPFTENFFHWYQNLQKLMKMRKHLSHMKYEALATRIKESYWDNHYFILYFTYSLQIELDSKMRRLIFVKIAENVGFLTIRAKEIILREYARYNIAYYHDNKRKKAYLTLKWGYKYLSKKKCLSFLKEQISKLSKNRTHPSLTSSLRRKLAAPFSN